MIARNYSEAWDFSEGLAPVWPDSDGGGFVYIDRTGKKIVKPKGGRWAFSDGLTVAGEYGKRVYVDPTADAKRVVHASLSEEAKALPGLAIVPGGVERGRCMHFDVLWSNPGTGSAHVAFYAVDLRSTALWTGVTGTCHLV